MNRVLVSGLAAIIGLWVADGLIEGIRFDNGAWLIATALLLDVINTLIRPVAVILTLPVTVLTLGFFLLVINAAMLGLTAWLLPGFGIDGFWSALFGSIIISLVSWLSGEALTRVMAR